MLALRLDAALREFHRLAVCNAVRGDGFSGDPTKQDTRGATNSPSVDTLMFPAAIPIAMAAAPRGAIVGFCTGPGTQGSRVISSIRYQRVHKIRTGAAASSSNDTIFSSAMGFLVQGGGVAREVALSLCQIHRCGDPPTGVLAPTLNTASLSTLLL